MTTETAVESTPVAAPETQAPKKAPRKKAVKKAPAAKREKKDGLRKPQVRILKALAKSGKPLTRAQIAEKASCDVAGMVEWIGSADPEVRTANDKKHFPSLVSLGLVKQEQHDVDGRDVVVYAVTAKGKAEASKA